MEYCSALKEGNSDTLRTLCSGKQASHQGQILQGSTDARSPEPSHSETGERQVSGVEGVGVGSQCLTGTELQMQDENVLEMDGGWLHDSVSVLYRTVHVKMLKW